MKYYNFLLILLCTGIIIFLSVFLLGNKNAETIEKERPLTSSRSNSVPVPEEVIFCGSSIKLDRIDMHERFDRELNGFTYLHSTTMLLIKRANRYFPVIEPILKKNGIPDDFKYLAVIESNLNIRALSPAKAAGIWQFMPDTGKKYGLEINPYIDERYHIEKATEAACKYLKEAYAKYGDWATAAASYNAGMGRISSELQSQMVENAFDLLLTEETSRYVFRILALKEIFNNPYKYGFILKKENLYKPINTKNIEISEDIPDFAVFAKKHHITYAQLKELNPWLRDKKLIVNKGKTYKIAIPDKDELFYNKSKIKVHDKAWLVD